jgi:hypothetical protein
MYDIQPNVTVQPSSLDAFHIPLESRYDSVHSTTNKAMNITKRILKAHSDRGPGRRATTCPTVAREA